MRYSGWKPRKPGVLDCACVLSPVWPFVTPWTVAHQARLSMWFSRQEHWSGLSFPSPGNLPNPGSKTWFSCVAGRFLLSESPNRWLKTPAGLPLVEVSARLWLHGCPEEGFFFIPASLDHLCLILAEGEEKKILVGSEAKEWKLKFNSVHLF